MNSNSNLTLKKHIILIGFKNVGKSTVGKALAEKLSVEFVDLDQLIELNYKNEQQQALSCREIFNLHGEKFFRERENGALRQVLEFPPGVIALGGGTPIPEENQILIKFHWIIHLTAEKELVFQRMMNLGRPAFFPENQDPAEFFQKLWEQRTIIYDKLANITVDNTFSVVETVANIIEKMEKSG